MSRFDETMRQPSNQLRGAQGASAHACSTGLSTGRRLMPMTARCCLAVPRSNDCQTVAVHEVSGGKSTECVHLQLYARVWTKTQLHRHARVWTKTQGCGRKLVAIQTVAPALPAADCVDRTEQVLSNVCRELAGCVERTVGHASIWIATSFACGCSCTRSVSSTQPAASHHLPRVGNCLTVAAPRHGAAAPHRAVMGIKRRPVERPVEHTCAEASRAPRN